MHKSEKDKRYTEDVVLNKILKEISEENLETDTSSQNNVEKNSYEDDLIKHYREKDILVKKQKFINTAKIITIVSLFIFITLSMISYIDTIQTEEPTNQNNILPIATPKPKIKKVSRPEQREYVIEKQKTFIPEPIKRKEVKTERELAKEMLLQEMRK